MAVSDDERLRKLLGEEIPDGGSETDTLFSDEQITDLLTRNGGVEESLGEGWAMKAAALATLVTTVEGSSTRKLSDAYDHALAQVKLYTDGGTSVVSSGRAKLGRIVRPSRV